ncbi:MAG TPA: carbamoyl phosphate synthase small subunit, partial [Parvularcula sp.]|nr:carbamoyl phosphate synthase small subunit [Parvularcula sp.]
GKVEIVSMNHGFAVDVTTLPDNVQPTFTSLFDGTNSGLRLTDAPAFSVQHHPEASPGPQDSFGVFKQFVEGLKAA